MAQPLIIPGVAALNDKFDETFGKLLIPAGGSAALRKVYHQHMPRRQTTTPIRPDLAGEDYRRILLRLHEARKPKTYLEIGVADGETLALARCASIGIDPDFAFRSTDIVKSVTDKPALHLFRTTSDEFFANRDPVASRRPY